VSAGALLGRAFRAGAFFGARFLGERDLFAALLFFVVRLAAVGRFFAVVARAGRLAVFFTEFVRAELVARAGRFFFAAFARPGRLVVFFAVLVRAELLARAGRFFFAALLRGAAFARAVRFFAVVLRGPVFLAVALRGLVPVDRFAPPALARVAPFFAGARRARVFFVALLFRDGGLRRRMAAGAISSSDTGGGVPVYAGCNSSAPNVRRPARHAAMMTAPNP
jgi:hypothetical protein